MGKFTRPCFIIHGKKDQKIPVGNGEYLYSLLKSKYKGGYLWVDNHGHNNLITNNNKKKIYSIYKEFIPKNNKWNKYIKSNTKEPNKELVEVLTKYFSCSKYSNIDIGL